MGSLLSLNTYSHELRIHILLLYKSPNYLIVDRGGADLVFSESYYKPKRHR